jgi:VWFA-related protein
MYSASRNLISFIVLIAFAVGGPAQQNAPEPQSDSGPQSLPAAEPVARPQTNTVQAASSTRPQPETATVLKVKTRLVMVDVVALDNKGTPVTNLEAEDFTLQEEGSVQKLSVFSFQRAIAPEGGQPAALTQETLPSTRITNLPRFKTAGTLNVLLLDAINVTSSNQKYTREQMLKFLEKLPAGQPIAVYAMGSKLRMLQDFTSDPSLLREAVKKAKDTSMGVRRESSNTADLPPGMLQAMPDGMLQIILRFGQDQIINQMDQRVTLTLEQLGALARNLAGYPGRKNLIWVSEAFPDFLAPTNADLSGKNSSGRSGTMGPLIKTYQAQIDHAADLLSNAQVAVYPVDAGTLGNRDSYSNLSNTDSNGNYLGNSARGMTPQGPGSQQAEISRGSENSFSSHATMNSVADQTGGRAFYNTNNIDKAIRESMEDGSSYYTLGYYPDNKSWDGRFRRITVKVARAGVKLHYRQGFFAVEPGDYAKHDPTIRAIDMGSALDINNPVSTVLTFQAVVVPPSTQNGNKVQINYGIDPHAIAFEQKNDGLQHAAVDCGVRVYTTSGEPLRTQGNTFNAALTAEQYQQVMKRFFPCSQTLELAPGEYLLRLAVRDNTTGLIGAANGRATVPAAPAGQESKPEEKKPQAGQNP